jgi:hydrogenase-1 operon protein HyaF
MPERGAGCLDGQTTGMAWSVLAEVSRLLEHLAQTGEPGFIDLRSLPLTAADRDELDALLGRGEVRADLDLAGASEVWETAYPGAWWVRHRGAGDRIAAEEIAVCPVPEILKTHPADIDAAARRLRNDLQQSRPQPAAEPSETTVETPHV